MDGVYRPTANFKNNSPRPMCGFIEDDMANTSSAQKCVRKMARKTNINKNRRTQVRTALRKVEDAIMAGDSSAARKALSAAEPQMMRAVSKGVFHKNTGARKISRLSKRVGALSK